MKPRQHIIPCGDKMRHFKSVDCPCHPIEDPECENLFIHNAKDCREAKERQGKHDESKPWKTVYEA